MLNPVLGGMRCTDRTQFESGIGMSVDARLLALSSSWSFEAPCETHARLVFPNADTRDSRMLILKSPLYPNGACVASVARLAILSPDLANMANFGPPPADFIFNFFMYLAIFEPHPASTGKYFPAFFSDPI